ncbi:hypothetical protein D9611_000034 [Ephemerocybe angulata]|uniref:Homeobox domain-containing protein n=1 Tax=Ephemerocybe angulata TaxID=980116 RepID=A0A8H5F769_9AGAR|nr:hypothetical protein D9611_000034 [Tulosesus angulatus]
MESLLYPGILIRPAFDLLLRHTPLRTSTAEMTRTTPTTTFLVTTLMPPHGQSLFDDSLEPLMTRSNSPGYGHGRHSSQMPSSHYNTPPPISPTSPEEPPMVKKKRKRADAAQLKVLNETYARTAFPSTEERHSLAKALDMSARSVQIWFQNKRQSMRQTNRQSNSNVSSSHQPYGLTSAQSERMMEEQMSHGHGHVHGSGFSNPQMPGAETPFMTGGPGQDIPRSHTSHSSSSHRRYRSPEDESHKQWSRGY